MRHNRKAIAKIEALFDPGESTSVLCDWALTFTNPTGTRVTQVVTLALTQERLHLVWFEITLFTAPNVWKFRAISLANLASHHWSFNKRKDTKGRLQGYTFEFGCTWEGQVVHYILSGPPKGLGLQDWSPEADSFQEHFKSVMTRHAALTAPTDIAGQVRAFQALLAEGVITNDEMQRAKELFLGRSPDQRQQLERSLRSLHELKKSGILNQIEFEIKKRDALARSD